MRLSFFESRKDSEAIVFGRWEGAGRVRAEDDFVRIEGRLVGAVGACECQLRGIAGNRNRNGKYHDCRWSFNVNS